VAISTTSPVVATKEKPFLGSASRRDLFLKIFEEVRQKYEFQVVGYVVMPEHIHLLIGEPDDGSIAVIMQVLKQRVSHQCLSRARSRLAQNTAPPGNQKCKGCVGTFCKRCRGTLHLKACSTRVNKNG
jgi:REP element-mobilizing transposase RayT